MAQSKSGFFMEPISFRCYGELKDFFYNEKLNGLQKVIIVDNGKILPKVLDKIVSELDLLGLSYSLQKKPSFVSSPGIIYFDPFRLQITGES